MKLGASWANSREEESQAGMPIQPAVGASPKFPKPSLNLMVTSSAAQQGLLQG